ncbi:S-layer homology domain-containing protein [Effusibacillus pohliae]|uniref:S-layer homology domain-containing protein n=1 Tax=Effusibacillus pohliae TaxID=232270 RepID=UPI00036A056D|nr:S-layer homology domain-containing protein [Effusibacillus pohliae]
MRGKALCGAVFSASLLLAGWLPAGIAGAESTGLPSLGLANLGLGGSSTQQETGGSVGGGGSVEVGGGLDLGLPSGTLPSLLPQPEVHQPFFVGYPDGKFYPTRPFTRAEAATVVTKVKNLKFDSDLEKPYTDVPKTHWAYKYITSVTKAGYMRGYGDGTFHPDEPITRAEMVALVMAIRMIQPIPGLEGFSDTSQHWAGDLIATARSLGMVSGVGNNQFKPDDATERQVAAMMFCVAFQRGPLKDGDAQVKQHFPDVKRDDWSFAWVEETAVEAHESIRSGLEEKLIRYRPDLTQKW